LRIHIKEKTTRKAIDRATTDKMTAKNTSVMKGHSISQRATNTNRRCSMCLKGRRKILNKVKKSQDNLTVQYINQKPNRCNTRSKIQIERKRLRNGERKMKTGMKMMQEITKEVAPTVRRGKLIGEINQIGRSQITTEEEITIELKMLIEIVIATKVEEDMIEET
jgi:hypothetical protein